jgi:release factor glutamine methyltransferase
VFAEDEAKMLIAAATSELVLITMLRRRTSGLPLEHVVGFVEFCGIRFEIAERVFVPRKRSELLVEKAAECLRNGNGSRVVVDLCCGCGAIGAAIAATVAHVELHAVDIEPAAVRCARSNIAASSVYEGDLYEPLPHALRGGIDLIVANAPYVPSGEIEMLPPEARLHEPLVALDGGADGLDLHRRICHEAPNWLKPGGHVIVEIAEHQAPRTVEFFAQSGLDAVIVRSKAIGATIVIGRRSTV